METNTMEKLKEKLRKCIPVKEMRYRNGFAGTAPAILSIVNIDEVAILP